MTSIRRSALAVAVATSAALSACAVQEPSPNVPSYSSRNDPYTGRGDPYPGRGDPYAGRGQVADSRYSRNTGVVNSIELVRGERSSGVSPGGAILGAVVGGLLGSQVGEGRGKTAATVAGVAGGALAGNAIGQRTQSSPDVYRVGILFDGGGSQSIDVPETGDLRPGDRVRVDGNQISRY